jgi:hypothetical protein
MADAVQWVAPITALVGALGGVWLGNRLSRESWLRERRWASREKYYLDLLSQLRKAELSLQGQGEYYEEPRSEHGDYSGDERFNELGRAAAQALQAVKELVGPAEVFLSPKAIGAVRELVREEWHAGYEGADGAGYIKKVLSLVSGAQASVIEAAKAELA